MEHGPRLLRATHQRLLALRDQVKATKPENADKGYVGSGLGPLVTGYKTLLTRVQQLTKEDPVAVDTLQDLPEVDEVSKHISAA